MEAKRLYLNKRLLIEWLLQQDAECVMTNEHDMKAAYRHVKREIQSNRFNTTEHQLHDIFYSDVFLELRGKHYKAAYEQGRFDEYTENTYGKAGTKDGTNTH